MNRRVTLTVDGRMIPLGRRLRAILAELGDRADRIEGIAYGRIEIHCRPGESQLAILESGKPVRHGNDALVEKEEASGG